VADLVRTVVAAWFAAATQGRIQRLLWMPAYWMTPRAGCVIAPHSWMILDDVLRNIFTDQ